MAERVSDQGGSRIVSARRTRGSDRVRESSPELLEFLKSYIAANWGRPATQSAYLQSVQRFPLLPAPTAPTEAPADLGNVDAVRLVNLLRGYDPSGTRGFEDPNRRLSAARLARSRGIDTRPEWLRNPDALRAEQARVDQARGYAAGAQAAQLTPPPPSNVVSVRDPWTGTLGTYLPEVAAGFQQFPAPLAYGGTGRPPPLYGVPSPPPRNQGLAASSGNVYLGPRRALWDTFRRF